MSLSSSVLAAEIENLTPTSSASGAATALANAYGSYMEDATSNSVGVSSVAAGVAAMASAMTFSSAGDGASQIKTGLQAFWAALVSNPSGVFSGASAITPPTFSAFPAALAAVFTSNTSGSESLEDSAAAIAAAIHTATDNQGTATFPGPITAPIT
jgi:hypothetical protein